jgi:hypothetical protein
MICQRGAAGTAKVPLCDVRAHEGRRAAARPAQVFAPDTRERHEWLTGCPLAHPAMAKARVLRRREQLIPHSSALTATSPLGRIFLDYSHVVFPMFQSRPSAPISTRLKFHSMSTMGGGLNGSTRHSILKGKDGVLRRPVETTPQSGHPQDRNPAAQHPYLCYSFMPEARELLGRETTARFRAAGLGPVSRPPPADLNGRTAQHARFGTRRHGGSMP